MLADTAITVTDLLHYSARFATGFDAGPVECATTVLLVCFAGAVCMCCACAVNVLHKCCKSLAKEAQENLKSELVVARTAYTLRDRVCKEYGFRSGAVHVPSA